MELSIFIKKENCQNCKYNPR